MRQVRESWMGILAVACLMWLALPAANARGDGACCLFEGCQQVADEGACGVLGGVFLDGQSCDDDACGVGACCTEGSCGETTAYQCVTAGRDFLGAGTSCAGNPCGVNPGACCLGDGSCTQEFGFDCANMGGNWLGEDSSCDDCPAIGACCIAAGDCELSTEVDCINTHNGIWLGDETTCEECPQLPACPGDTLFGQRLSSPNDFLAGTSEAGSAFRRFERFESLDGAVDSLTWWGVDLEPVGGNNFIECEEEDNTFVIAFHPDAGGEPGALTCTHEVLATRTPTGIAYLGAELNEYSAILPEPCVMTNGWVSIWGQGDPTCWFLWMSSPDGDDASFCEGCFAEHETEDFAYCLQGVPGGVFGACCDDATGMCTDDVEIDDCSEPSMRFAADTACEALNPPCGIVYGACCMGDETCERRTQDACSQVGGNWLGANSLCSQCPCVLGCPDGGIDEGEPVCFDGYNDTHNVGCDGETPVFLPIEIGDTICGTNGVFVLGGNNVPDPDWYELTIDEPTRLVWTVRGELPVRIWIFDGDDGCPGATIGEAAGFECNFVIVQNFVAPGTYWFKVAAALFTDESVCGAGYVATLSDQLFGDANGNGVVGLEDYAPFADCLSGPGQTPNPPPPLTTEECLAHFDGDEDGDVDADDYARFLLFLAAF